MIKAFITIYKYEIKQGLKNLKIPNKFHEELCIAYKDKIDSIKTQIFLEVYKDFIQKHNTKLNNQSILK